MNHTIYKYEFEVNDQVVLELPALAKILTVQLQGSTPCVWAIVDPGAPIRKRVLRIYGTGHPIEGHTAPEKLTNLNYIGSIQLRGGALVFHVFDAGDFDELGSN